MTSRARVLDIYARREAAQVAGLGRAARHAAHEQAEAEALVTRLRAMALDVQVGSGPVLAATLRASGMLAASLTEEAARQDARAETAGHEVARLRQKMGFHDRRSRFGETAAAAVRQAEAEAAEARAEAARPTRRRG